jgi:glycogen synthase
MFSILPFPGKSILYLNPVIYVIYYNIQMRKKLNILFVASEASPFAKEGGLGDMVGALSATLWKMGHKVIVVIPRYHRIDGARFGLRQVPGSLDVPMKIMGTLWCRVFEGKMPGSGMTAYFVDIRNFTKGTEVYTMTQTGMPIKTMIFAMYSCQRQHCSCAR